MKRKIYLASSWRNLLQPQLVKALRDAGHEVYDFRNPGPGKRGFGWSEIDPQWRDWTPNEFRRHLIDPIAQRGFANDWNGMEWADTCVMLMPCGRSAHLEAGYFAGAGKPLIILLAEDQEPELMYKMADFLCVETAEVIGILDRLEPNLKSAPVSPSSVLRVSELEKTVDLLTEQLMGRPLAGTRPEHFVAVVRVGKLFFSPRHFGDVAGWVIDEAWFFGDANRVPSDKVIYNAVAVRARSMNAPIYHMPLPWRVEGKGAAQ